MAQYFCPSSPGHRRAVLAVAGLLLWLACAAQGLGQMRYTVQAGDRLRIEVLEDESLNRELLVLPDGTISFPYLGALGVAGQTTDAIAKAITRGIAPQFAIRPTVNVSVRGLGRRAPAQPAAGHRIDVFLTGEIAKAGKVEVAPGTTLLQVLAQAGGVTGFAARRRIELHRHDPRTGTDRIYVFSLTGRPARGRGAVALGTEVQAGDVILVPTRRLFE